MGCLCDMHLEPWGALVLGCIGGAIACLGINFITPILEDKLKVHDTCDCMALHGICAFASVFASCIAFSTNANAHYLAAYGGSAGKQAGRQIAAVFACAAIGTGLAIPTGFLMSMFKRDDHWYDQGAHLHGE
jgi:ammonia channel protein AmtB